MSDWTLYYDGVSTEFGDRFGPLPLAQAPKQTANEHAVQDAFMPGSDRRLFGRDDIHPGSVQFGLLALAETEAEAKANVAAFAARWRADAIRRDAGSMAQLIAPSGRIAFGRPRAFDPDLELVWAGDIDIACQFDLADPVWWSSLNSKSVSIIAGSGAGLVAPLVAPLTAVGKSVDFTEVTVTGDVESPITVTFYGPLTNGRAEIGDLVVELSGTVPEGQSCKVDALTRTVVGGGGAGLLSPRSTPLSELLLEPGQHTVFLEGVSATGTASITVSWRNAYTTY